MGYKEVVWDIFGKKTIHKKIDYEKMILEKAHELAKCTTIKEMKNLQKELNNILSWYEEFLD